MALPNTNLSINSVNTETGRGSGFSTDMAWIDEATKSALKPTQTNPDYSPPVYACACGPWGGNCNCSRAQVSEPTVDLAGIRGAPYYQRNMDGNCNTNPLPSTASSSGNIQCTNCSNVAVNCANCDSKKYFQADCNCNCTYNCTLTANQSYNCNCNCNCACWFSDDNLKIREDNITDALAKVNSLDGFFYRGNETAKQLGLYTGLDVGVSAQAVEKTLPAALGGNIGPDNQYKTVRYERLVPLLIEAIKELDKKVNELTKG